MKKPAILIITSILFVTLSWSQNIADKDQLISSPIGGPSITSTTDLPFFSSSSDAEKIVAGITNVLGLDCNFKIKAANVPNVEATIRHHKRYILYNPEFINEVNAATKNKWASIFILAHEVGHHLEGHTVADVKSRPNIELQADQFAGYVLCKMGSTLDQAQLAMFYLSNIQPSKSHPGRLDRLTAIKKGWDKAAESGLTDNLIPLGYLN